MRIAAPAVVPGSITSGYDYYSFNPALMPGGFKISIIPFANTNPNVQAGLVKPNVTGPFTAKWSSSAPAGQVDTITVLANSPGYATLGVVYIAVFPAVTTPGVLTEYELRLDPTTAPTPAPTPGTERPVVLGQTFFGTFATLTEENQYYTFSYPVPGVTNSAGINFFLHCYSGDTDLYLSTVKPSGYLTNATTFYTNVSAIRSGDDSITIYNPAYSGNGSLNANLWQTGKSGSPAVYYLMVAHWSVGDWSLLVTDVFPSPVPEPFNPTPQPSPGTNPVLKANQAVAGTLSPGKRVCWRFQADRDSGEFSVTLSPLSEGAILPPVLTIYKSWSLPYNTTGTVKGKQHPINGSFVDTILRVNSGQNVTYIMLSTLATLTGGQIFPSLVPNPDWLGPNGWYVFCASAPSVNLEPAKYYLSVATPSVTPVPPLPTITIRPLAAPSAITSRSTASGQFTYFSYTAQTANPIYIEVDADGVGAPEYSFSRLNPVDKLTGQPLLWTLGSAVSNPDGSVTLVNGVSQSGAAWLAQPLDLFSDSPIGAPGFGFTTRFRLEPSKTGKTPTHGFCVVAQNAGDDKEVAGLNGGICALGNTGNDLGVGNDQNSNPELQPIKNSVGVCISTNNGGNGYTTSTFAFKNGDAHYCLSEPEGPDACAFPISQVAADGYPSLYQPQVGTFDDMAITFWFVINDGGYLKPDELHWQIFSYETGVYFGSYVAYYPEGLQNALGGKKNTAFLGWTAGTNSADPLTPVITQYAPVSYPVLLAGNTGGSPNVYISKTKPLSVDTFTSLDAGLNDGAGYATIDVTPAKPYFGGVGATYYIGVYCDGPATCNYQLTVSERAAYSPTATRSVPPPTRSNSPTPSGNLQPVIVPPTFGAAGLLNWQSRLTLTRLSATYVAVPFDPAMGSSITLAVSGQIADASDSATPTPKAMANATNSWNMKLEWSTRMPDCKTNVAPTHPACGDTASQYVNVPVAGTGIDSCYDLKWSSGTVEGRSGYLSLTATAPSAQYIYVRVVNQATVARTVELIITAPSNGLPTQTDIGLDVAIGAPLGLIGLVGVAAVILFAVGFYKAKGSKPSVIMMNSTPAAVGEVELGKMDAWSPNDDEEVGDAPGENPSLAAGGARAASSRNLAGRLQCSCGVYGAVGAKFCNSCGSKLAAPLPNPLAAAVAASGGADFPPVPTGGSSRSLNASALANSRRVSSRQLGKSASMRGKDFNTVADF